MKIDKITFLLLAFQLISNVGFGQADSFSGTTTHKGKAIAYVNIGIQGKAIGTVSDENGEFTLYLNRTKLSNEDTLVFSRIGYSSMYFSFIQLNEIMASKHPLSIELDEKVEQLNEVIVRSRVAKTKEIGSIKKSLLNMNVNFSIAQYPNQNLGSEIGRKFNIRKQHTKIMSFRFYLQHNNFDDVKFRLNIYDIEKNGRPRKNLLTEHIVLNVRGRKTGWIEVDLSPVFNHCQSRCHRCIGMDC